MPVGVVEHEKSFCLYFLRFLSLSCVVRFELLFSHQRDLDAREATHRDVSGSGFRGFLFLLGFPLGFGVVVFTVVPKSPEKSPKESYGPPVGWSVCELKDNARDRRMTGFIRPERIGSDWDHFPCSHVHPR